uniref:F-box domain-containing protein n=1 Tax=Kalmanozyma brasiliensis (strain GHG001) TaxID=1365824 RepID=V5F0A7_KALBG
MNRLLADETILRILSYLDAKDLVRVQQVSKHLRTLAKDRLLWKRLFYFNFVRPTQSVQVQHDTSAVLPTLRELGSLLLHQNVLPGKHVTGDGPSQIQRLPDRFYSSTALHIDVDRDFSSLYLDSVGLNDTSKRQLLEWEQIYSVSRNWQRGNFAVSELFKLVRAHDLIHLRLSPLS